MKGDMADSIDKVVKTFQWLYRGRIIQRKDGGFLCGKVFYQTFEELDDAIDKSYEALRKSINRIK